MSLRIGVVGAGLGGIAAAGRLAADGHEVLVFESQSFAGGKAGSIALGGYRFDTGPSLLTMPEVFDDWFAALGFDRRQRLDFFPLEPITSYFFPDGTSLESSADRELFARRLSVSLGESPRRLRRYLDRSARIYRAAAPIFLQHSLHEWATYRSRAFLRALPRLPFIRGLTTLHTLNRRSFGDPRTVQLFDRYATYNGSDPYRTPGTMSLIPHVEYNGGARGVAGGIAAIPEEMRRAAEERGVKFRFDTPVERILLEGKRVAAVEAGGERIDCDAVVSNADVISTYEKLLRLPEHPAVRRYRRLEPSSSGLVFYLGVERSFPQLTLHNIFFSSDYASEFRSIFAAGELPADPTIYVNITSKATPGDAPPGCENWFVLLNAPARRDRYGEAEIDRIRERTIATIGSRLGEDIGRSIAVAETLTPAQIEERTGSTRGSLYGIASNSPASAFLRHPNRSRDIGGLYFVGGSAHPGGGMPLALLSGRIVAGLIRKHGGGTQ